MTNSELLKLALGGLTAGFCLLGQSCYKSPVSAAQKSPSAEEPGTKCSGGPTCASCTVPDDCSDVSDCKESGSSDAEMLMKRQKAARNQKIGESECKKI